MSFKSLMGNQFDSNKKLKHPVNCAMYNLSLLEPRFLDTSSLDERASDTLQTAAELLK